VDLGLLEVVFYLGHFDHKKSIEYQVNSDLLLYLVESIEGREMSKRYSGVLPAKIFEYMYAGVPILAIVPSGFESNLIMKTKTGFIAEPNDVLCIKEVLFCVYKTYKEGLLKLDPNEDEVSKYNRKNLTGDLVIVFNKLLSNNAY